MLVLIKCLIQGNTLQLLWNVTKLKRHWNPTFVVGFRCVNLHPSPSPCHLRPLAGCRRGTHRNAGPTPPPHPTWPQEAEGGPDSPSPFPLNVHPPSSCCNVHLPLSPSPLPHLISPHFFTLFPSLLKPDLFSLTSPAPGIDLVLGVSGASFHPQFAWECVSAGSV